MPSILEFMDRKCLDCIRNEIDTPIPRKAGAMLLIEVDGDDFHVKRDAENIRDACFHVGVLSFESASSSQEADRLWEARRNVSPSLLKLRPHKISEDIVVPRNRIVHIVTYLDELGQRYGLPIPVFGHAGDGNLHINIMLDKNNPREGENASLLIRALFEKVIKLGGTITGEHGIGITKKPYLEMEISRTGLGLMSRIKEAFDPRGILNPGKIFYI